MKQLLPDIEVRLGWLSNLFGRLILFCLPFILAASLAAQPSHDTKGKEFWVAFMETAGREGPMEQSDLRLYLSAIEPTEVRITYWRTGQTETINLPVAHRSFEVDVGRLFGSSIELNAGDIGVSSKTLRVQSDEDITLYGVSVRIFSSDAFLGLPEDVLTRRYILLAYPNGFSNQGFGVYDMPSEFAVVATEDGTLVTITPTANINERPTLDPFVVGLNKGEVYFAQASLNGEQDVTGTQIRARKPIAVFSGNKRTSIPTDVGNFRDLLVEQMPPLESWGNTAIIPPLFDVTPASSFAPVARIVAAFDNTTWDLNGVPQPQLRGGVPIEIPLDEAPMVITASGPILVAQYEHSVGPLWNDTFNLGDPFMMIIPPELQYDTSYAFQSVPHPEFVRHYLNVVIPTADIPSLRIDSMQVNEMFRQVPGTIYSYAQVTLTPGAHTAYADAPFGLYSYGYGQANSYGYPGGAIYRVLVHDFQHPYILTTRGCARVNGTAIDNRITDSGIDSCYVIPSGTRNANVTIQPFTSGDDSVFYSATLIDPYQDGSSEVKAIDSGGRSVTQRNAIAGFTVGIAALNGGAPTRTSAVAYNGNRICREFEIINYGNFKQTISNISPTPDDGLFTVSTLTPITVEPGERRIIQICFESDLDSTIEARLTIGDSCVTREIIEWKVHSVIDTIPPVFLGQVSPCGEEIEVIFNEPDEQFLGIASVEFVERTNADVTFNPVLASLPASQLSLRLRPIDPFQDVIYEVRVTDLAGNQIIVQDTLGGFTVAVVDPSTGENALVRSGVEWKTDSLDYLGRRCDSILLSNYGTRTVTISRATLQGNLEFSIPPSQFPVTLNSGENKMIAICLEGHFTGNQLDTLLIIDSCGRIDRIPLKTPVDFGLGHGVDRCGQNVTIRAFAPSKRTLLMPPFPNPTPGETIGLDIGLQRDEIVTIEVLDMGGESVLRVLNRAQLTGGLHRLQFEPVGLESGLYFCRMMTANGEVKTVKMVVEK